MELNSLNYYSKEADLEYMSATQYKAFAACEAAALAELQGRYVKPTTPAMLVGGYVDAHFEGTLDVYRAKHPELFKRDGELKSEYRNAEEIIRRMERDPMMMQLLAGRKQVIVTGRIAGVPFKGKIDSLLSAEQCKELVQQFPETRDVVGFGDGMIVDGKVMRDTKAVWSDEEYCKLPFVEAWGYDIQGAIYQALEGHRLPFVLAVATKEEEPDLEALVVPGDVLAAKLEEIEQNAPHFDEVKHGRAEPYACGRCPWCRSQKVLQRIIDYRELGD